MRVAVIGLGLMGGTIAGHLIDDGHAVTGYDPEPDRRAELGERGGMAADSVADAIAPAAVAILSLPNSSIMLDIIPEIAGAAAKGLIVVDTTTGAPADSIEAARQLADAGIAYTDATISGNAAQTAEKDIIFMLGATPEVASTISGLLQPMCRNVYHVGPVGAGSRTKLVVNHILSINRVAIAEGLAVAEKAGLDLAPVLEVLKDSAAYSKAMDIWGGRMVGGDYYPPKSRVRQSHKDARLIRDHANELGASIELQTKVREELEEAESGGLSDADNASVMEVMRRRAGIGRLP
ncbi:MAG: NAD(P)-dependent oxidoreductase [Acidimicrobiia bacterium]|nr:NAD(P)-dependent oxidoreductase [Acidimicrobiia bacterium]